MFYSIQNHISTAVTEIEKPWDLPHPGYPNISKDKYKKWCAKASTNHYFLSGYRGEDPSTRIGKTNPPVYVEELIIDYDYEMDESHFMSVDDRWNPQARPNYVLRTKSGGARAVFRLGAPLIYDNKEIFEKKLKKLAKDLELDFLWKGIDEEAYYNPSKYYELGTPWLEVHNTPLDADLITYINLQHATSKNFEKESVRIPYNKIEEEMDKRGWLARWGKPVQENERGCRFWDDASWNTGSSGACVMLDGGCYNHSNRGKAGFNSWEDIFGTKFVKQFEEKKLGRVIKDWYYCGRYYYNRSAQQGWITYPGEVCKRLLKTIYGMENRPKKGEFTSELEEALSLIETQRKIDGAVPFPMRKEEVISVNDEKYLNISNVEPVYPKGEGTTRKDAQFILDLLESQFNTKITWDEGYYPHVEDDELLHLLCILKRFYESCLEGRPVAIPCIFIAGAPGTGKSLFSYIFGLLCGGSASAKSYIIDNNRFSEELCRTVVHRLDDAASPSESMDYRVGVSKRIKQHIANPYMDYEKKHGTKVTIPHCSALFVTLNDDSESARMIPDLDISNRDKICIYKLKGDGSFKFPSNREIEDVILPREISGFGQFLKELQVPDEFKGGARFGIKTYVHPDLEKASAHESDQYAFREILHQFFEAYCEDTDEDFWEGTASKLLIEMSADGTGVDSLARRYTVQRVARGLNSLSRSGSGDFEIIDSEDVRKYRINLDKYRK